MQSIFIVMFLFIHFYTTLLDRSSQVQEMRIRRRDGSFVSFTKKGGGRLRGAPLLLVAVLLILLLAPCILCSSSSSPSIPLFLNVGIILCVMF